MCSPNASAKSHDEKKKISRPPNVTLVIDFFIPVVTACVHLVPDRRRGPLRPANLS